MRKFIVNVNGKSYEVEVEEVRENSVAQRPVATPVAAPAPKEEAKPETKAVEASQGQEVVKAPMPGNIWKLIAAEGQEVKEGDVLLILEAMKMENEIVAPRDGKVSSILVSEGSTVGGDQDLVILD